MLQLAVCLCALTLPILVECVANSPRRTIAAVRWVKRRVAVKEGNAQHLPLSAAVMSARQQFRAAGVLPYLLPVRNSDAFRRLSMESVGR